MFIETRSTPDPGTLKFLPGRMVLAEGTFEAASPADAAPSPLATRLFEVPGVSRVALGPDWIAVSRPDADWQTFKPAVLGAIMEHYLSGAPAMHGQPGRPERFSPVAVEGDSPVIAGIREALRRVIDPELGYNILDLGLIYGVDVAASGATTVTMTTTTPGCPATAYLKGGAGEAARSVAGVAEVEVILTHDPRWGPEMMSPAAKTHFGIGDDGRW